MPCPRVTILVAFMVAGCASYQPPVGGDHSSAKYRTDLAKCRQQAEKRASQIANATPSSAVHALFTSDEPEHEDETKCMVARGYPKP